MNSEKFVSLIRLAVRNRSIEDTIENLKDPPGRKVPESERARSNWFHSLNRHQREMIEEIVRDAVDETVFGMLAVIDGARPIENVEEKGKLLLIYQGEDDELLNDPKGLALHDLYNAK